MNDYSSTSSPSTNENASDITMLPDLPPGRNERLRAPLEFPNDVELDDIEVTITDSIIPPNEQSPRHYHPGQDFLYVVEGSAEHIVDGQQDEIIEAGDARVIPYAREHESRATEEGTRVITFRVHEEDRPERILEEDHEHGDKPAEEDHENGDENIGFIGKDLDFAEAIASSGGLQIEGSDGNYQINGSDGNDIINSGNGDDTINGGAGDDTLNAARGLDLLDGGAGTDVLALFDLNRGDENIGFVGEADNFTFFVDGADEGTFLNIESVEFDNGEVVSTQDLDFSDAIASSGGSQVEGSDITMLPDLPPGSNDILSSPLESPKDIDDIEVIVSDVVIPPNEGLPRHYHPGEEFLYILEGSTIHDIDGEPFEIIEAGDGRVIPYERKHQPSATNEGARVLVFRVHEEGQPETFLVEDYDLATIDLTDSADRTVEFTVNREAGYDNTVGFYEVNEDGSVRDPISGQTIAIGKEGYQDAALANSLDFTLSTDNGETSTFTSDLAGGKQYATFLIVNGGLDELLDDDSSNDPAIYFDTAKANTNGFDYIRDAGSNTFEFEDIPYGINGVFDDKTLDYNDLVVEYDFI